MANKKKFRFTENVLIFLVVTVLAGVIALAINAFVIFVTLTYELVQPRFERLILRHSAQRVIRGESSTPDRGWLGLLRRTGHVMAEFALGHASRIAHAVSGPISLTVGVLLMVVLLQLATTGGIWIAVAGIALIVTTLIEGSVRGYRRFLGITFACAIGIIAGFVLMILSLLLEESSP